MVNGGTLGNTSGTLVTLSTANPQNWNADIVFSGPNDLNLGTGAVTLGSSRTVTVTAGNLTVGGAIGGAGFSLTKAGARQPGPRRREHLQRGHVRPGRHADHDQRRGPEQRPGDLQARPPARPCWP